MQYEGTPLEGALLPCHTTVTVYQYVFVCVCVCVYFYFSLL